MYCLFVFGLKKIWEILCSYIRQGQTIKEKYFIDHVVRWNKVKEGKKGTFCLGTGKFVDLAKSQVLEVFGERYTKKKNNMDVILEETWKM